MSASLARFQREFQRSVLEGDPRFERRIAGTARAPAARRLAIYSGAYRARLVESLGREYPGLRALAGEARFERLAGEYVASHPSLFTNLRWYGGDLARFLAATAPYRRTRAFAEMAAFEWTVGVAFDSPDAGPLTVEDMARFLPAEWPRLRFTLHPSVRRIALGSNVPAASTAAQPGRAVPRLKRVRRPVTWLVWRQGLEVRYRSLAHDEARALEALAQGATFAAICARLADAPEPAARAAVLLKGWVAEGLISAAAAATAPESPRSSSRR